MSALSNTFTSYLGYISAFFVSGTVSATGDKTLPVEALTKTIGAIKDGALKGQDPTSNFLVDILLAFFDKEDVIVLDGIIYLHGIQLIQVLTVSIAIASFVMVLIKGALDLALLLKKWRLDKLEREIAELGE